MYFKLNISVVVIEINKQGLSKKNIPLQNFIKLQDIIKYCQL